MRDQLRRWVLPVVTLALAAVVGVGLLTAAPPPSDRAGAIASRLRCPVCQGVSVADSPSDTAQAMRARIDELIAAGATDEEVFRHFVERYGQWVLLQPPLDQRTVWLWLAPGVVAAAGIAVVVLAGRGRRATPTGRLTDAQRRVVAEALAEFDGTQP
ncbi:MAG: cytochrome c-type biogenesis protein CcmH [Actinomycetota bacterium]|nr:cytochrome c-type biogenesis protein CcmH [Actinomycetota bacterium]